MEANSFKNLLILLIDRETVRGPNFKKKLGNQDETSVY